MDRNHWAGEERPEQVLAPGAEWLDHPVERLQALLDGLAAAFAERHFGTCEGIDLRLGRRGLVADEAASFLRGLDAGLLDVDPTGGVRVGEARTKPGGGRYSLFSANRYGGDLHVALNLEYLIQLGASCELLSCFGWPGADVAIEVGEFDAVAYAGDRVVLAMEAKARVDGPDSLSGLWKSLTSFAESNSPPDPLGNHSRKYVELMRLAKPGPVVLWLVAAQARWSLVATKVGSRMEFEPLQGVDRDVVIAATADPSPEPQRQLVAVGRNLAFAVEVARLTELDGQQRCYEYPWNSEAELDAFLLELRDRIPQSGLTHARAWKWRRESSGGVASSPSGRSTGIELRFSYYA